MQGTVVEFDEPRGLGEIEANGVKYPFHCTALLDGTRAIDVGATVDFEVRPAGMGRWEATRLQRV